MKRKQLPIGIQSFREIRQDNHYYVDKTGFASNLVEQGKYYFLSRPRRFGKSLFLDTLKELFEGNRDLFAGLEAEHCWVFEFKVVEDAPEGKALAQIKAKGHADSFTGLQEESVISPDLSTRLRQMAKFFNRDKT